MADFLNKIVLNEQEIFYKELKVKHLKVIYKTLLGDDPNPETVFINFNNILKDITSLTQEEIYNLNFVNYFLLLLEIRAISIGNSIFAQLQDGNVKIEFNLSKIKTQLEDLILKFQNKNNKIDNSVVIYDLPSVNELLYINQQTDIDSIYSCFVKNINSNNNTISIKNIPIKHKNYIFEKLPVKITSVVIKEVLECISYFNSVNLISYMPELKNVSLIFNLNIKNLVAFLKFLFGDGLLSLYENIFALCKLSSLTPEYIENCTPGEYLLFIKKLEQLNSKESEQPLSNSNVNDILEEDLKDIDYNPYNSPDMPPVTSQANLTNFIP